MTRITILHHGAGGLTRSLVAALTSLLTTPVRVMNILERYDITSFTDWDSYDLKPISIKRILAGDNFSLRDTLNLLMLLQQYYGLVCISQIRKLAQEITPAAKTAGFETLRRSSQQR